MAVLACEESKPEKIEYPDEMQNQNGLQRGQGDIGPTQPGA